MGWLNVRNRQQNDGCDTGNVGRTIAEKACWRGMQHQMVVFFPPMDHVVPNFVGSLSNVRGPWPKLETFLLFQWPGILSSKDDVQRAPLSLSRALLEGIYKNKKRRKPYLASQHNCCWWGVSSDSSSMATGINSMQFKTHHSRTHTPTHTPNHTHIIYI